MDRSAIRIYLFETLRVHTGDREFAPDGAPAKLLGHLGLYAAGGAVLPRARLAGRLWPDCPDARARRILTVTLYRLRRMLGDYSAWLHADGETVGLSAEAWIDARAFRAGVHAPHLADWRAALALYTGELLSGLDDEWVLGPRAELNALYLAALERTCAALASAGRPADALSYAREWVAADPLGEEAHRTLMRLYALLGRSADALQAYERLARSLHDELQVQPLPETQSLAAAIRVEQRASAESPGALPLAGRQAERAALLDLAERAQAGRGTLALVEGEAGIGKTRLLEAVVEGAAWRGFQVAWGRACAPGSGPYAPLAEALQEAFAGPRAERLRLRLPPATVQALAVLVPRLRGPASPQPVAGIAPALVAGLRALCEMAPCALLLDGVQGAGAEFWEVLLGCAPYLGDLRLLLVLSYRGGELRENARGWPALRALDRDLALPRVVLNGLAPDECAELARNLGYPLDPGTALLLQRRTGGNPLLVRETLARSGEEPPPPAASPAQIVASLARADVPLGRALEPADRVTVRWTVDDGAGDAAVLARLGRAALRRHRLQRLLAEARAQEAAPTDADLAGALGVSVRTVQRDIRTLQASGRPTHTRRRARQR